MSVCACIHAYVQMPVEAREGIRAPGSGVISGCEPQNMGAEIGTMAL